MMGARKENAMAHATAPITPAMRTRFERLAAAWKEQSRYLSNTAQMALLPPYQRIIGMGMAAVPLILDELQREPRQWFWALEAITEENPVPPATAGNVRQMARAWLDWGKQHGLLTNGSAWSSPAPASEQSSRHQPLAPN